MAGNRPPRRKPGTNRSRATTHRAGSLSGQRLPGGGRTTRYPIRPLQPSWGRPATPRGGVPAAGAAAAPAAPAPPAYNISNLPPDASYDAVIAQLQRQRDEQMAALTQQRTSTLLDYGFTEGPNGALAMDMRNPYSRAALLKQTYDRSRRSTAQSMGAGGQLYAGSFQTAQDYVNRNEAQASDAQQKQLLSILMRNTQARAQAGTGFETAAAQAYADRIGRFQSNPLYDPAAAGPEPVPAAAAPAAAAARRRTIRRPRPFQPSWRR